METKDFKELLNEVFDPEKLKARRVEEFYDEYITILSNIIDKKRDEDLLKIMFSGEKYSIKELLETIDKYEDYKKKVAEQFRKSVTVNFEE